MSPKDVVHRALIHADEVERGEYAEDGVILDRDPHAQNCDDAPCDECDDEYCGCDCHVRHNWTDVGRDEPEGLEETDERN